MKTPLAVIAGFLTMAGMVVGWLIVTLPDQAECVASGRIVDPTERHCEAGGGYVQLEEHALFHASEVLIGVALVLAVGYGIHRYWRHRARSRAQAA